MSKFSNSIFPPNASNDYQGHKIALWGLTLLTVMSIARGLVHLFKSDGGAQSIATIPLDSYTAGGATAIISLFAFWGFSQLLLGLFYVVVLTRYRNLIPLALLSILIEWSGRLAIGYYKPVETIGQAPASLAVYIIPPVVLILLFLSLPNNKAK